ncbi:hypothetical protein IAU60_004875 [Kwoniella sp. DSM 27419]
MTTKLISLEYTLYPPSSISEPVAGPSSRPVPASSTLTVPVPLENHSIPQPLSLNTSQSETARYYSDLTTSVRQLQLTLNDTLTAWKDAVGDLEKSKEDQGKVAFGRGRATVMSLAVSGEMRETKVSPAGQDDSSSEESEDE